MRRAVVMLGIGLVLVATACSDDQVWFSGDLDQARLQAGQRGTLIMLDFYTDWCSWCKRLDRDTFSDARVRKELAAIVALRLNAEKAGEQLAVSLGVGSYPTIVFLDAEGDEVDRVLGYLPPDKFLERIRRIRTGDTFSACLERLEADPADLDALSRAVGGLLARSDPDGALDRIRSYHQAVGEPGPAGGACQVLFFEAASQLHSRVYERAGKLYRKGWLAALEVDDVEVAPALAELAGGALEGLPSDEQAWRLKEARQADAAHLLERIKGASLDTDQLFEAGRFAAENGRYQEAGALYRQWFELGGRSIAADELNEAAWSLYLAQVEAETAIAMAQMAMADDPTASIADTLGRLLYLDGDHDEALAMQAKAVSLTDDDAGELYLEALELMRAGEPLGDQPAFERYPGSGKTGL